MPITPSEVQQFVQALNQSGTSIPLSLTSVSATEPTQFWVLTAISVVGVLFMLFWAFQMFLQPAIGSFYVRYSLWRFKQITGRNFILVKHTRNGLFESSMIDARTLEGLESAIASFNGKPFDLILHTPGGAVFYTQILSKIIKEYSNPVRCFVPYYAMSGGTMLALSCSEIYMGNFACLGPVDPQLGSLWGFGSAKSWAEVLRRKGRKANDSTIQFAFMGNQYTKTLKENIKCVLSDKITDVAKLEEATDFLTSGTVEHAYQLSPMRLMDFGIKINPIDEKIQKLLSTVINKGWIEGVYWG